MIRSFADKATEDVYDGVESKAARTIPRQLWNIARRKLDVLEAAHELRDLAVPPGNRLERLKGRAKERHSIRVNDQYRITFEWVDGNAVDVLIEDYH